MTLSLLEGAITALDTYLQGGTVMADILDVIDAEHADGITLEDIQKWYLGNIPREQPEFPSICLQGVGFTPEDQEAGKFYPKSFINILVFAGEADDQVRFKLLCRYARAVIELVADGESSYGYHSWLEGDIVISDTMNTTPFIQAVMVPISLYPLSGETYT